MKAKRTENEMVVPKNESRRQGGRGDQNKRLTRTIPTKPAVRTIGRTEEHKSKPPRRSEANKDNQKSKQLLTTIALWDIFMAKLEGKIESIRQHIAFARGYATAWAHFTNHEAGKRVFNYLYENARKKQSERKENKPADSNQQSRLN